MFEAGVLCTSSVGTRADAVVELFEQEGRHLR
jgi:hypothetical protein